MVGLFLLLFILSFSHLQLRADFGNQWNGMYYGAQLYNGYGYAAQFPDPTVYAAPYGAYSYDGNQQQVS